MTEATEQELIDLLDRAEPELVRRALAHVAGRLAEAEGVPTAARTMQIVVDALHHLPALLQS